jgi:hypothetical protein
MHEEAAGKPNPDRWRKPLSHQPGPFGDDEIPVPWTYFPPDTLAPAAPAGRTLRRPDACEHRELSSRRA